MALARKDYFTHTFATTPAQHTFLGVLEDGRDIEEAPRAVAREHAQPIDDVRRAWATGIRERWITGGLFVARP